MTLGTAEAAVAGRAKRGPLLGFDPVPLGTADAVVVAEGYTGHRHLAHTDHST